MKKKDLIAGDPVPIPHGIKKDKTVILTGKIISTKEGRVLETDIYESGIRVARHFTGRKGYWTQQYGKWSRELLDSTLNPYYGWGHRCQIVETMQYKSEVKRFLGRMYYGSARSGISDAERDIRYKKQLTADERKRTRLKKEADSRTPALPKDFMKFVRAHLPKPGDHIGIQLFQRTKTGRSFVERQFRVELWSKDAKTPIITEEARGFAGKPGDMWTTWVYGIDRGSYGIKQKWWHKKGGSCVSLLQHRFILYTGNISELRLDERQERLFRELTEITPVCEWSFVLRTVRRETGEAIEHMLKAGLTTAAREYVSLNFYQVYTDDDARNLYDYFGITPQQLAYLKEVNGGWRSILFLQKDDDGELRPSDLKLLEQNVSTASANGWEAIRRFRLPLSHVVKLLGDRKGHVKLMTLTKYLDYLRMAIERGGNVRDEIIYRNKRWNEFHDRYIEELNARRAAEQAEKRRAECKKKAKKFAGIRKDYKRNTALFSWEKGGYCIEVPRTYEDIITEGQRQHHCVGATDTYMERMARRESFILFLRKTEDRDKPYYTIEATTSGVKQFYAEYDRQPDRDKVRKLLAEWMRQVRKRAKAMNKEEAIV